MKILAIETSCDETAICLLEAEPRTTETGTTVAFTVLNNITHTQLEHQEFGGVFPAIAKREHQKNLPLILEKIMDGQTPPDYICVTNGPGLEPALWCGIVFAKELGAQWNIPVIPVNHMEGHILSVIAPQLGTHNTTANTVTTTAQTFSFNASDLAFPIIALLISGGHTELVSSTEMGSYQLIGKTKDDAVGEAFDKVARMMNLPYPGGPEIAKLADQYSVQSPALEDAALETTVLETPTFPRPMMHSKDFDFSFSGLKTAVLYYLQDLKERGVEITKSIQSAIAYEFQEAAAEVLAHKTKKALIEYGAETLVIGGGVAANKRIVGALETMTTKDFPHIAVKAPTRALTGDNALMIALAGYFKIQKNPDTQYPDIVAVGNLTLE